MNRIRSLTALLALILCFTSCNNLIKNSSDSSIVLTLPGSSCRSITPDDISLYQAMLVKNRISDINDDIPDKDIISRDYYKPGSTIEYKEIDSGVYTVLIAAYIKEKTEEPAAYGFSSCEVKTGETSVLTVRLSAADSGKDLYTQVTTAAELKTAVENGDEYIQISGIIKLNDLLTLNVNNDLWVTGADSSSGINGNGTYIIINGDSASTICFDSISFTGGSNSELNGGGILSINSLTQVLFYDCNFKNNFAQHCGGSVYVESTSSVIFNGCTFDSTFTDNFAGSGGYLYVTNDCTSLSIENSSFSNGKATYGGALDARCSAIITDSSFTDNKAEHPEGNESLGGAINMDGDDNLIENCTFSGNTTAYNYAGDHDVYSSTGKTTTIRNCGDCQAPSWCTIEN